MKGVKSGRVAMVLGGAALFAGACGSSHNAASSSATSSPATTAASGSGQLGDVSAAITAGEKATFKAVYTATDNGSTQTVTIEQKPPATRFATGDGAVISSGGKTYFCSTSSSAQCVVESGANPLAGLINLYSPATALSAIQAAQTALAAHVAGVNVSYSQQTFAGQSAKCVSVSGPGSSGRYCVTDGGILAYVQSGSGTFQLTSYSSDVSDADFQVPSGASTVTVPSVTLPSGVTLPPGVTIPGGY